VRKLAKELGVDLRELTGSGPHGDITRVDVQAWVRSQTGDGRPDVLTNGESSAYDSGLGSAAHTYPAGASGPGGVAATTGAAPTSTTPTGDPRTGDPRTGDPRTGDPRTGDPRTGDPTTGEARTGEARTGGAITGGVRRVPIRGLRRATAAAMVSSAFTAPHVTEFLTVDVTRMIELRDRLRARRDWVDVRLSPLTFAAKAVCLAARRTPEVNGHWDEEAQEIVFYERVQLGIAAATQRGLMVPKIRDADLLGLRELATALTELTEKARGGTTTPKELVGGTITITNVGVFGVDTGTPILNPGESAILALGAVKQAPWVVDGELAVRTVCHLALSFDHRVVDGEQGSRFLADVGALLSDPGLAMTF
jgi:pyruvate dehydrogenase E2 component (dihydrolipoamide acetyltransferase)